MSVVSRILLNSTSFKLPISREKTLEFQRYRELVINLTSRDIKVRYKRSVLGLFWTVLQPVLMTLIFTIVFSSGFRAASLDTPLYILSGYVVWNYLAQTTLQSLNVLQVNGALMKRVALPRSVFVVSTLLASLVNFLFSLIPLFLLLLLSSHSNPLTLLFLPVSILITSIFVLGLSLLLAPLALFFDDFNHFYQVLITMWFFLTPVVYVIAAIPPEFQFLMKLNPMTWMLELFRAPVYLGTLPDLSIVLLTSVTAALTFIVGWWSFARLSNRFVYYL